MYQIFKFQDRRKRQLNVLTKKPASRWDDGEIPAQWSSRQAAHKWAKAHLDLMPFGYIILEDEASLPVDGGRGIRQSG